MLLQGAERTVVVFMASLFCCIRLLLFLCGRVLKAAQDAISSSLLEVSIDSATGVLFNVTGPMDLGLAEVRGFAAEPPAVAQQERLGPSFVVANMRMCAPDSNSALPTCSIGWQYVDATAVTVDISPDFLSFGIMHHAQLLQRLLASMGCVASRPGQT
jgi:hypothetical protein